MPGFGDPRPLTSSNLGGCPRSKGNDGSEWQSSQHHARRASGMFVQSLTVLVEIFSAEVVKSACGLEVSAKSGAPKGLVEFSNVDENVRIPRSLANGRGSPGQVPQGLVWGFFDGRHFELANGASRIDVRLFWNVLGVEQAARQRALCEAPQQGVSEDSIGGA